MKTTAIMSMLLTCIGSAIFSIQGKASTRSIISSIETVHVPSLDIPEWEMFNFKNLKVDYDELKDMYVPNKETAWFVGYDNVILQYDQGVWKKHNGSFGNLKAILGSSESNIFAAGDRGVILHFDGNMWSQYPAPSLENFRGVWVDTDGLPWVISSTTVWQNNGKEWIARYQTTNDSITNITGSKNNGVWINASSGNSGSSGTVANYQYKTIVITDTDITEKNEILLGLTVSDSSKFNYAYNPSGLYRFTDLDHVEKLDSVDSAREVQALFVHEDVKWVARGVSNSVWRSEGPDAWVRASPTIFDGRLLKLTGSDNHNLWGLGSGSAFKQKKPINVNSQFACTKNTFNSGHRLGSIKKISPVYGKAGHRVAIGPFIKDPNKPNEVWNVLYELWRYDGSSWSQEFLPETIMMSSNTQVFAYQDEVWVIGNNEINFFDGQSWTVLPNLHNKAIDSGWLSFDGTLWTSHNVPEAGHVEILNHKTGKLTKVTSRKISKIQTIPGSDKIWVLSEKGIVELDGNTETIILANLNTTSNRAFYTDMKVFSETDIWVTGYSHLLFHFDGTGWLNLSPFDFIPNSLDWTMIHDEDPSNLWFTSRSGEVFHFTPMGLEIIPSMILNGSKGIESGLVNANGSLEFFYGSNSASRAKLK